MSQRIPILMYHSISEYYPPYSVPPETFAEQMRLLHREGYEAVSFADLHAGGTLPSKPVLITFDDGYRDNYEVAFPIMRENGMKATIFVVSGWTAHLANMTADMMREMANSGYVEFGAHTVTHPRLTLLSAVEQRWQIAQAKADLEATLGRAVDVFSYPYGVYDAKSIDYVQECGYRSAVTVRRGLADMAEFPYTLPRLEVFGQYNLHQFSWLLSGREPDA